MFSDDSYDDFDINDEDYYGHEYFDYMLEDMYDSLYDLDFEETENEYENDSDQSRLPEEKLDQMKRCLEVCTSLNQDRKDGLFCDTTIEVEGQTFNAHKTILKASSSYFTAMFTGDFSEKTKKLVEVRGVSPQVFETLLDYMYVSDINLTFENLREVYVASDMLCIDALITKCKNYVKNNWAFAEDKQEVYEMAKDLGLDDVAKDIVHQARTHLLSLVGSKDYCNLSETFLCTILEDRTLLNYFYQEASIANFLLKWVFCKPDERLPDVAEKVFNAVHFGFVTKDKFVEMLQFISTHENSLGVDILYRLKNYLEKLYETSRQKMIDQHVMLVLPDESESARSTLVQLHLLNFEDWKWELVSCQVSGKPQSYIVSDNELYIFTSRGCTKVDICTKKKHNFPSFPESRAMSVFCVSDGTLYVTGGCRENSMVPLNEILHLRPPSTHWSRGITWRKSRCDASSIAHGKFVYFVGGRNIQDKNYKGSECFSFNRQNKHIQRICSLNSVVKRPKLAIFDGVLYVFAHNQVMGVNLKARHLIPDSALKSIELSQPILAVCSVREGVLIAYSLSIRILLALFRPTEEPNFEYLGLVSKPPTVMDNTDFSYSELIFYNCDQSSVA